MTASPGFLDYAVELFEELGEVRARRMFGGAGLFVGDAMFGLIADDRIYLKLDEETRPEFDAAGAEPFVYETKTGRRSVMSYAAPPDGALEDEEARARWGALALAAAERAAVDKRKTAARKKKTPRARK